MKAIYKPNDTVVEDLNEVIKILEKTNRHVLTGSIINLRNELKDLWEQQHEGNPFDEKEERPLNTREVLAFGFLRSIIEYYGSWEKIEIMNNQIDEAFRYADAFLERMK